MIANPDKPSCRGAVRRAVLQIAQAGRKVVTDPPTARLVGLRDGLLRNVRQVSAQVDLLLVFGGDGTILRIARETAGSRTPILGVNVGNLGFLTAGSLAHLNNVLAALWSGGYVVERRSLIEARCEPKNDSGTQLAFNDFVVSRSHATRLIELEVLVDGRVLTRYRCDGLIVSSPTGSTAYSLAAGGAIVTPDADVLLLTPICPHTLSNRPVILSLRSVVQIRLLDARAGILLAADGQVQTGLETGDVLTVRRSRHSVPLVFLEGTSFFETLRRKLRWSGSSV